MFGKARWSILLFDTDYNWEFCICIEVIDSIVVRRRRSAVEIEECDRIISEAGVYYFSDFCEREWMSEGEEVYLSTFGFSYKCSLMRLIGVPRGSEVLEYVSRENERSSLE